MKAIIVSILLFLTATTSIADSCSCFFSSWEGWTFYIAYEPAGYIGQPSGCCGEMGGFSGWYVPCNNPGPGCETVFFSGSGGWACQMVPCCAGDPECDPMN